MSFVTQLYLTLRLDRIWVAPAPSCLQLFVVASLRDSYQSGNNYSGECSYSAPLTCCSQSATTSRPPRPPSRSSVVFRLVALSQPCKPSPQLHDSTNAPEIMLASLLAIALAVVATPVPQSWVLRDAQLYTLRANWSVHSMADSRSMLTTPIAQTNHGTDVNS